MILKHEFKTFEGARKRAAFENAHCNHLFHYTIVCFRDGVPNARPFDQTAAYKWRLNRVFNRERS
jgi:hypothetical protein